MAAFTYKQGQFLAFIHCYTRLHRRPPAEADLVRYFQVTAPSVHSMIVKLGEMGLLERTPGAARSLRVLIPEDEIPRLDEASERS